MLSLRYARNLRQLRIRARRPGQVVNFSNNLISQEFVVGAPTPDIVPPTQDIYRTISERFSELGEKIAIVDGQNGREYCYNELHENISKFSTSLQSMGFRRGDVMCVVSPNNIEYPVVFLGVLRSGGTISTCNPAFTANELAFQFNNSNAKIAATTPQCLPAVQEAAAQSKVEKIIVIDTADPQSSSKNLISYQSMLNNCSSIADPIATELDDVAILPYSSGTTGFPKGVMLTNYSVLSNVFQIKHPEILELSYNPSNCLFGMLPFFHIYGMVAVLLSSLYAGTKIVSLSQFEPETFLNAMDKYEVNIAHLVPPLILFLAKHPLVKNYKLSSLEDIISGAAPLGGDLVKAAEARINCRLIRQGYGLTETSPVSHMMPRSLGMQYPGSIGHCIRSTLTKIVDPESGDALPPDCEGEVWISGPQVMKGYLNNPEATRASITPDGWFRSGDVGYYDKQGLFYITDRLKELIKVKGLQVAPAELEAVLVTHPKIADAAVVGVSNDRLGEAPKAFVVKKDESLSEKDVEAFIAQKLAKHKHLAGGVEFIGAVPKSPSGKILRRLLRK